MLARALLRRIAPSARQKDEFSTNKRIKPSWKRIKYVHRAKNRITSGAATPGSGHCPSPPALTKITVR
jgi:hypothetical protein